MSKIETRLMDKNIILFLLLSSISLDMMAKKVLEEQNYNNLPFKEFTLDGAGEYELDLDFDGYNEKIIVDENSNISVFKIDQNGEKKNISNEIPYCMIRIHRCCEAHRAYTTVNYLLHTLYSEAHYGCCDMERHQFRKVGDKWIEEIPIKPLSVIAGDLHPKRHLFRVYIGQSYFWKWSNNSGGVHYRVKY